MFTTGALGAIPRKDVRRMRKHAIMYYEEIRKRDSDVDAIAANTGFGKEAIRKIKEHVFHNFYHLDEEEPTRFDADYDMAVSWQRLIDGKDIREMDIVLLHHELTEHRLMNEDGLSYDAAHAIAENQYNYSQFVRALDLREGIK